MEKLCEMFADMEEGRIVIEHNKDQEPIMVMIMEAVRSSSPELIFNAKKQGPRTIWTIAAA